MLIGRFIPGRRNVLEDQLSRWHQVISKEWILHPRISQAVLERWGTPMVAVRHRPQSATPSVLFASTRPLGMEGRRLHGAMGSSRSLCLPVLRSLLLGHQPCVGDQQLRMILVAPARVVSGSAKPSSEEPLQLPPFFWQNLLLQPYADSSRSLGPLETSRLEVIERSPEREVFSRSASREIASYVRSSSSDVYQGK